MTPGSSNSPSHEVMKDILGKLQEMHDEMKKHETRMDAIADLCLRQGRRLEELENSTPTQGESQFRGHQDDRSVKLDLPDFDGSSDPEVFFDWVRRMESIFEYKEYDDARSCKMAVLKLTKLAGLWYDNLKAKRRREGKDKIESWMKLKKKMEQRWVPHEYVQDQYVKLTRLAQGERSVDDYVREFEKLSLVCDMQEKEPLKIARFTKGLSKPISNKVDLLPYSTYEEVVKAARKVEAQHKEDKPRPTSRLPYKAFSSMGKGEVASKSTFTPNSSKGYGGKNGFQARNPQEDVLQMP
ncbi:uncharacterized protein LOC110734095 [Chenopodium quinoa]|uniref:uncharacterized protein LOC110734095 n=1 Tax=Chenopodium quinoa TaxID=63459 RepID=UPI000B78CC8C|nr:uncharacterized protein LOC110734095 [Chenopodium quinoa]